MGLLDRTTDELSYVNSTDGVAWNAPDLVFSAGTGGWYPSLAMDPVNHEPAIAFVVCSAQPGPLHGSLQFDAKAALSLSLLASPLPHFEGDVPRGGERTCS